MRINLTSQVLSFRVGTVLKEFGPPDTSETAELYLMVDKFFDMVNTRSHKQPIHQRKTELEQYTSWKVR